MAMTAETKQWINDKYIECRNRQEKGKDTITAFSIYLGVSRNSLNNWMNRGKTPDDASAVHLSKLGPEIFDLLGLKRPHPLLLIIMQKWGNVPDDAQKQIVQDVLRAEERGAVERNRKGVDKLKRN